MNARTFLAVSVALNLLLMGSLARNRMTDPTADISSPATLPKQEDGPAPSEIVRDRVVTVTNRLVERLDWRSVESEDYRRYIANLRSIGCPEETIADIVKADLSKSFKAKRQASEQARGAFQFWKPGNPFVGSLEQVRERQQLAQEQRTILKELLGKEPGSDAIPESNPFADVLSFLSPQQQQQVADIRERFKGTMRQGADGGESPEERRQKMRDAERQMEDDLSRIMTPQEKEDHDLRLSQTAAKMREHLASFEPTEQEFRSLFRYRKEFEGTVADLAGRPDGEALKQAAEAQFFDRARGTLGESRYADFLRALGR